MHGHALSNTSRPMSAIAREHGKPSLLPHETVCRLLSTSQLFLVHREKGSSLLLPYETLCRLQSTSQPFLVQCENVLLLPCETVCVLST